MSAANMCTRPSSPRTSEPPHEEALGGWKPAPGVVGSKLSRAHEASPPAHSASHAHTPLDVSHTPFSEQSSSSVHAAAGDANNRPNKATERPNNFSRKRIPT